MHTARFTVITPECIRIESSATGRFIDGPSLFALGPRARGASTVAAPGGPECVIDTGRIELRYRPDGHAPNPGNMLATVRPASGAPPVAWWPGLVQTGNLGGTLSTLDGVRGPVPLGDGLLSRDGWHLLDDSRQHLLIDGWAARRPGTEPGEETPIDWYFFGYGRDYRGALRALAAVAGPVPMPRRAALGSWYSRYWPYTSAEFREIVEEYDRRGFPLDVMVLDMDWHRGGWTGWSWNRELLPDAEELLEWLHRRGLAVTLNVHPSGGVGPHEDAYTDFMLSLGRDPASRKTVSFDAGDRAYMRALFERVHRPLEDAGWKDRATGIELASPGGVDFWWLDWQQERFTRSIPDLENLRWLNELYFAHTGGASLSLEPRLSRTTGVPPGPTLDDRSLPAGAAPADRRGISFSRWAGWGDHRHPVHFSGDSHTGWDSLAFQVPFTSTAGNVGCFFWSHDIGGHFGARIEEATARWVQFGALSATLRLHSARSGDLDRRPWAYEPRYERCMRGAFSLRSELFPYVYTAAAACREECVPLIRPVYLDNPDDPHAHQNGQEYLLGDDLLAAPIVTPGIGARKIGAQSVWFPGRTGASPDGGPADWFHWFTHEWHAGGTETIAASDIESLPLYARAGALIPMRPPTLRMTTDPLTHLVVRCFPGRSGSVYESSLYEDDGVSRAYEHGQSARTRMVARWMEASVSIDIGPTVGKFEGGVAEREYTVEVMAVTPIAARIDGRAATAQFDPVTRAARVRVPARPTGAPLRVEVDFVPQDRHAARRDAWRGRAALAHPGLGAADPDISLLAGSDAGLLAGSRGPTAASVLAGIAVRRVGDDLRVSNAADAADQRRIALTITDRRGDEARDLSRDELLVPPEDGVAVTLPRAGCPEPVLGVFSRREASLELRIQGRAIRVVTEIEVRSMPLSAWRAVGPFPFDPTLPLSEQAHGPEHELDAREFSSHFRGADGPLATWRSGAGPAGGYWPVDLRHMYGSRSGTALAYAVTFIHSPGAQEVNIHIESGDRGALWVNRNLVFTSDRGDPDEPSAPGTRAALEAGWNRFLAKTTEGGGGWGFKVSVDGRLPLEEREGLLP